MMLVLIIIVLSSKEAAAYLDPGAGSLIVQLLIGGAAGLIMALKLYWEKLKSIFKRTIKDDK